MIHQRIKHKKSYLRVTKKLVMTEFCRFENDNTSVTISRFFPDKESGKEPGKGLGKDSDKGADRETCRADDKESYRGFEEDSDKRVGKGNDSKSESDKSPDKADGYSEYGITVSLTDPTLTFDAQMDALLAALGKASRDYAPHAAPVFIRLFLSDPAAQQEKAHGKASALYRDCAISCIGQPPLNGTKIALWAWLREGVTTSAAEDGLFEIHDGRYHELWTVSKTAAGSSPLIQAEQLLDEWCETLERRGLTLKSDCMRTWFFVRDIDTNYREFVTGRNNVFDRQGLTAGSHFIASTGIDGATASAENIVMMDAMAIAGSLKPGIRYLHAETHLNRTSQYGVRFERGVALDYDDRRRVFISGTASIDNRGRVVAPGDIRKQTARMIENVAMLLKEAGCKFNDVSTMIVYLRDTADYAVVRDIFNETFSDIPWLIVLAPICRPAWLVEMECVALK